MPNLPAGQRPLQCSLSSPAAPKRPAVHLPLHCASTEAPLPKRPGAQPRQRKFPLPAANCPLAQSAQRGGALGPAVAV